MKKVFKRVYLILLFICLSCVLNAQSKTEPWKSLFNGYNLDGWQIGGCTAKVVVKDGAILCNMINNTNQHTFVYTKEKYGDFILEMDFQVDKGYNSGVIFRAFDAPKDVDSVKVSLYGYQVKIDPSTTRKWTGGIFEDYGATWHWLYSLKDDERAREAYKIAEWNKLRIEAVGSNIKVWVNGIPTVNMMNERFSKGYIAIKIHKLENGSPQDEAMHGQFKNIFIITEDIEKYFYPTDLLVKEVK